MLKRGGTFTKKVKKSKILMVIRGLQNNYYRLKCEKLWEHCLISLLIPHQISIIQKNVDIATPNSANPLSWLMTKMSRATVFTCYNGWLAPITVATSNFIEMTSNSKTIQVRYHAMLLQHFIFVIFGNYFLINTAERP